jgi:hypothetical protein
MAYNLACRSRNRRAYSDASLFTSAMHAISVISGAAVKTFAGKSDDVTELYMGQGPPIWNNRDDTTVLRDAGGNAVSQRSG